jgi:cytochrome o ubiquinol oxidase operon protein cyoD
MNDAGHPWNISFKPIGVGFVLSLILLVAAYVVTTDSILSGPSLLYTIIGLGTAQALLQVVLFLHVGLEEKPQWNLLMFLFMALIIFLLIGGSLWIMYNLDYNMMLPM